MPSTACALCDTEVMKCIYFPCVWLLLRSLCTCHIGELQIMGVYYCVNLPEVWVPRTSVLLWFLRVIYCEVQPVEQCDCNERNTLLKCIIVKYIVLLSEKKKKISTGNC